MIIVGLLLCPVSVAIILTLNKFNIKKSRKKALNLFLVLSSLLYIALALIINKEPFKFEVTRQSDYLLYSVVIFLFSPFLWINLYYFCKKIFRAFRINKNAKIKSNQQYNYYRNDLNKISPSIVMVTSTMETDVKKSISAVMLKLKLTGYIEEINNKLRRTNKDENKLLESEKMVLKSLDTKNLDEYLYKKLIEKEALENKYLKRNRGGRILKLIKILITILIPIILINYSMKFDRYVYDKYKTYIYDGKRYVSVQNGEIGDIHFGKIKNIDDYYHGYIEDENKFFYDKALIRADKFENSFVKETAIFQNLDLIFMLISMSTAIVSIFFVIEQLIYFNKNYRRTKKGIELLDKAYALKNYLKDYSLIKNRTEEELVLWEYYLIYAVVLDVNVKIKDTIIEKYFVN